MKGRKLKKPPILRSEKLKNEIVRAVNVNAIPTFEPACLTVKLCPLRTYVVVGY